MNFRSLLRHSLLRAPALSLGVIATLAVGVGALTATFAALNAALLRQPPFRDAERLAVLKIVRDPIGEPPRQENWSYARYTLLGESQRSFSQVAIFSGPSLTLSGAGADEPELVRAEMVSASYFPLLGLSAARGRVFGADEDAPARPAPVALVSHDLWARRWASDPALIGRTIRANGVTLTVVGVMPRDFHGVSGVGDVWVPATMTPQLTYAEFLTTNQNFISVLGRLRDGVSLAQARGELAVLGASINRAAPSDPERPTERVSATALSLNEARADRIVRRSLLLLFGAVTLLHLLACANVTNLLLGRAAQRRREGAVRVAIGSSARRLFAHLLLDQAVVAVPGALVGVLLAWWATALAAPPTATLAPGGFFAIAPFDTPAFGARELAFGLTLSALTVLLVSIPPALGAFGLDVPREIKAGARGIAGGAIRLRRPTLRGAIVALEAALAVLLVVGAGLLVDSFRRIRHLDLGVDTTNVLTFWMIPREANVPRGSEVAYVSRVLDAVRAVPGVRGATVDGGAPLAGTARAPVHVVGRDEPPPGQEPEGLRHYVAPEHFQTLGIPLRRGRTFGPGDVAGAPRVTVISEGAARRFWPNEDPIGKRVWFGSASATNGPAAAAVVVGVVGDVLYEPLDRPTNRASFYTPYAQFTYAARMVFVRTAGDPLAAVPAVRRALQRVDPDVVMRDARTLDEIVHGSSARQRTGALLFGAFGVAALLLAASGVFAVLAYVVAGRTREFGIRIALGADRASVVRLVVGEGLLFPAAGLVAGVAASLAATRVLRSALYEVSPLEPRVFAATVALLVIAAVAACAVPAWRATRADPLEVMRAE
jgi:putative ABC transport system permease protein